MSNHKCDKMDYRLNNKNCHSTHGKTIYHENRIKESNEAY